jgi:ABC-type transport system involved in multi-copper enzyme maturation permease subunit
MGSFRAELLLLRKRGATWILLAVAIFQSLLFTYLLPYTSYLSEPAARRTAADLRALLPERAVSSLLGGFPFYFATLALILGAVELGSEYGWGTLKTTLMQQPSRLRLFLAKAAAIGVVLAVFAVSILAVGAGASYVVALRESAAVTWPPIWDVVRALGAGWLILTLWALFGSLLAILSRGTAVAIGLGIVYGLVVEGLVTGFGSSIRVLHDLAQGFLRTNGYSLIAPLRHGLAEVEGPGAFSGPFVDPLQALLVITSYVIVLVGISALILRRRDVT